MKKIVALVIFLYIAVSNQISPAYAAAAPQYPWEKVFDDSNSQLTFTV